MHPLRDLIRNQTLMSDLALSYGTPSYIYDQTRLNHNLSKLHSSLKTYFDKYHICYAVKANSNPHLLKVLDRFRQFLGSDRLHD